MFRSIADVVQKEDLRELHQAAAHQDRPAPDHHRGRRAPPFAPISATWPSDLAAIEARKGKVQKGDDIHLAVITDGRHAAIDMRLVWPGSENEPANKLNELIANVYRIWGETAAHQLYRPDGSPIRCPAPASSSSPTSARSASRPRAASRPIAGSSRADRARRAGIEQIAFMQDYKKSADKQRIFRRFQ